VGQPDCASKGVAVLFTNNFEYKIHILKDDKDQKGVIFWLILKCWISIWHLEIYNIYIYAPSSGDHPEFFDKVINEVMSMDNELIVIGADWTVALNPKIDSNQPSSDSVYHARSRSRKK